ncbi:MAG: arginine repressor [Phycisphaerae bacterium]|nr:arginine repressor [Phycisphaerae bacterium]
MRDKSERQVALRRLVRRQAIANQNEMVSLLNELGFKATQASVSRDVRELGLVRVNGHYVAASELDGAPGAVPTIGDHNELITSVEPVGANLIVIKTPPGAASAVAIELDKLKGLDIVGTVAGDDTVFVAVRSRSVQGRALVQLRHLAWRAVRADGDLE